MQLAVFKCHFNNCDWLCENPPCSHANFDLFLESKLAELSGLHSCFIVKVCKIREHGGFSYYVSGTLAIEEMFSILSLSFYVECMVSPYMVDWLV